MDGSGRLVPARRIATKMKISMDKRELAHAKVERIISSSETHDQLTVAHRCIELYRRNYEYAECFVGELFGALTDRRKSLGPSVAPMPPAIYSVEQMVDELETSGSLYCRCGKCIEQNVDFKHDLPMSETFVCVCGREYSVTTEDHLEYGIKKIK